MPTMARIAALLFLLTLLGISEATALADSWSSANKTGNDGSVTSTAKDEGENLRLKAPKPKVKSQLIKEAPEVDLENGDGDIDKDGAFTDFSIKRTKVKIITSKRDRYDVTQPSIFPRRIGDALDARNKAQSSISSRKVRSTMSDILNDFEQANA